MPDTSQTPVATHETDDDPRMPWVAPRVETIAARDAREGTRPNVPDGGFTTS